MIKAILITALLVYLVIIISIFIGPLIIGLSMNGIEGLKDMLEMIKNKDYYLCVAKPVFILYTFLLLIAFLIFFLTKGIIL